MAVVLKAIDKKAWAYETIKERCLVGDGLHGKVKRIENGVLYLSSKNLKDGGLDLSKVDYISIEDYQKHFKEHSKALTKPKADDVIFGIIGTIGEPYLVKGKDQFGLSSSVAILRPDTSVIHPKFLYYWVKGPIFQQALYSFKGGVAQGYLSLEMIRALPLNYPPIPQQQKIAAILSAYDDLIENNTRRIALLEAMAQALYREWFVHFRYPGHGEVPLVDSPLGPIPQGWEVKQLKDFGDVITGKTPSKKDPENFGQDVPFIKIPDMHGNMFCLDTAEKLSLKGVASQKNKTLPPNSLCVSCIGTAGLVIITDKPSQTNQQINSIVLKHLFYREFLYFRLLDLKDTINNYGSNGATIVNLNKSKFEALQISAPKDFLVDTFSIQTAPIFELIKNLQNKNNNLRQTRDLLLPRLISGQLDVSELEIASV